MTASDNTTFNLTVTGDVVVDHHIYEGERLTPSQEHARGLVEHPELGGAGLVHKLLAEVFKAERDKAAADQKAIEKAAAESGAEFRKEDKERLEKHKALQAEIWNVRLGVEEPTLSACPRGWHALAVWRPYPDANDPKKSVWRAEKLLGYGAVEKGDSKPFLKQNADLPIPSVLVLDESGFRFREKKNQAYWSLTKPGKPEPQWIVLKMAPAVVQGDLWYELIDRFADKLVCVVSADDLRRECVSLSKGLSWERTIEEAYAVVLENPALKDLAKCRHLVVRFALDGALWIDRGKNNTTATLIFDAAGAEGIWGDGFEGKVVGYSSSITAAVAHAIARHEAEKATNAKAEKLNLSTAIAAGLAGARDLLRNGHGQVDAVKPAGFPAERLARVIVGSVDDFSFMELPMPEPGAPLTAPHAGWSLIELSQRAAGVPAKSSLVGLAHAYLVKGEAAIKRLPHAKFGKMTTVDRVEIEALRGIRSQMLEYRDKNSGKKPLSIGVFGPPGAGKSFGVRQLADEVFPGAWLEFNLSQFDDAEDLIGAFHQVRDRRLKGAVPVVFWDEFDSRQFQWLQYLLAPMQDGAFQEGQVTHAVGKSVFIFAGGTSASFAEFGRRAEGVDAADFRLKKGPDFHSRLDAYYDVLGPNPHTLEGQKDMPDPVDICFPLRRALLARSLLGAAPVANLDFDSDLADALLLVPKYKHGARSLEKLVTQLNPAGGGPIRRSNLPAAAQMDMHVDAGKFSEILNKNAAYRMSAVIEKIARSIHNSYYETYKNTGSIAPRYNMPYDELEQIDKDDNLAAARRIPEVLALAGLGISDQPAAADGGSGVDEINAHIEHHIERLAEAEHDGWMSQRIKSGWSYGPIRNDDELKHPLLVEYAALPEEQKEKDRQSVRRFRAQVEGAKYRLDWL